MPCCFDQQSSPTLWNPFACRCWQCVRHLGLSGELVPGILRVRLDSADMSQLSWAFRHPLPDPDIAARGDGLVGRSMFHNGESPLLKLCITSSNGTLLKKPHHSFTFRILSATSPRGVHLLCRVVIWTYHIIDLGGLSILCVKAHTLCSTLRFSAGN